MEKGRVIMVSIHFLYPAIAITVIWLIFKVVNITFIKKKFELKKKRSSKSALLYKCDGYNWTNTFSSCNSYFIWGVPRV